MIDISQIKLLAIDDDEGIIEILELMFSMHKDVIPQYELFTDVSKFISALKPNVHICIVDYFLHRQNGLSLIQQVLKTNPYCWFIMFSGQKDLQVIIDFMNNTHGSRYIEKGSQDFMDKMLTYIKDIVSRITKIESLFFESYQNRKALKELNITLTNLKENL